MLPTRRLYEEDPYLTECTAAVVCCTPDESLPGYWSCALEATVFYPEGGGQPCDLGTLDAEPVLAVHLDGEGVIWHRTARPLPEGQTVTGRIDWDRRFDHMQQHTGEHILSGTLHRMFGAENVGFHIGSPWVRMDMSLPLTPEQLTRAEQAANRTVQSDGAIRCWYPRAGGAGPAGLPQQEGAHRPGAAGGCRRGGSVRLLRHPCGHRRAGGADQDSVGAALQGRRAAGGGPAACGAVTELQALLTDAQAAGGLMSVPAGQLAGAAKRLLEAQAALKQRAAALQNRLSDALAEAAQPRAGTDFAPVRHRRGRRAAHLPGGGRPDRRPVRGAGPRRPGPGLRPHPARRGCAGALPPAECRLPGPGRRQGGLLPGEPAGGGGCGRRGGVFAKELLIRLLAESKEGKDLSAAGWWLNFFVLLAGESFLFERPKRETKKPPPFRWVDDDLGGLTPRSPAEDQQQGFPSGPAPGLTLQAGENGSPAAGKLAVAFAKLP